MTSRLHVSHACYVSSGIPIPTDDMAEVRRLVELFLEGQKARVFLFGSRAWGGATPTSDVDIAIQSETPLRKGTLSLIREALEDSRVPFHFDVIDLSEVDVEFRCRVLREGIPWHD